MNLILASASIRRRELLATLGVPFVVRPSAVDEQSRCEIQDQADWVEELSRRKAMARVHQGDDLIIGADTLVCCDRQILGKPADQDENFRMLQMLAGREHQVYGGIAVYRPQTGECSVAHLCTRVRMHAWDASFDAYARSGDGRDKAGGYGIQTLGGLLVAEVQGCYENVVGLSRQLLVPMLREAGVSLGLEQMP